jgi:penicillin V acylase-like amidase (Ntn superfamily)
MLWSDVEVRAALVKVHQDILEEQGQAIEDAKNRLSNYESPVGNLMNAAADLNFHTKWRNAATNLIETLYFQLFGEEFGSVNAKEEKDE